MNRFRHVHLYAYKLDNKFICSESIARFQLSYASFANPLQKIFCSYVDTELTKICSTDSFQVVSKLYVFKHSSNMMV